MTGFASIAFGALALLVLAGAAAPAWSQAGAPQKPPGLPASLGGVCERAIVQAAQRHDVPVDLLLSIGAVESSGHPFALNIDGKSLFPPDYRNAESAARAALTRGASVDIGCMQINVSRHHREAFPSLLYALHPEWNADYGARFLRSLYERHNNWTTATAHYHSSRREAQLRYVSQVARRLNRMDGQRASPGPASPERTGPAQSDLAALQRIRAAGASQAALAIRTELRSAQQTARYRPTAAGAHP